LITITITNDETGGEYIANYEYTIRINGNMIQHGKILHHDRRKGLRELLRLVASDGENLERIDHE
jgi:hypothetical protein